MFDSGVGGLSVLKAVCRQMPGERILFFADQAHVPYGPRPLAEVRDFSFAITRFLLERGVKLIVVACNTASAAALHDLRLAFPATPFVGMEPAVKPAAEHTRSGAVGVLATSATFQGALYASVIERFAREVTVYQDDCLGLVAQIEAGELNSAATRRILEKAIQPMLAQNIDTIVLGCTHYPFVIPLIEAIAGPGVRVIDPAPAIARQVGRVLAAAQLAYRTDQPDALHIITSGNPASLANLLPRLLGEDLSGRRPTISQAKWNEGSLHPVRN